MNSERERKQRFRKLEKASNGDLPALTILLARGFVRCYPQHGPAWLHLAIALVELGRYEEAEQALSKALEFCPKSKQWLVLSHWGHLCRFCGDYEQAANWHRKQVEAAPNDASGYIFLGAVLAKSGRLSEAEEAHRAATRCSEGRIDEAYLNLGFILRARQRFAESAKCFRKALEITPDYKPAEAALRDVECCLRHSQRKK
jgi:tetratricopeptide (TPR) repeat protein